MSASTVNVRIGEVEFDATAEQAAALLREAADKLARPPARDDSPLDVKEAAAALGVSVEWVREHAAELGGWRVSPDRPKSPWRFDRSRLLVARQESTQHGGEDARELEARSPRPRRRRRSSPRESGAPLLEVRGSRP